MSQGYASITLVGNVGKPPEEINYSRNGEEKKGVRLLLAVNDNNSSRQQNNTQWHQILAWQHNLTEFAIQHIKTGDTLLINGTPKIKQWEIQGTDQQKPITTSRLEVIATQIKRIKKSNHHDNTDNDNSQSRMQNNNGFTNNQQENDTLNNNDNNIPF
ncbi:MAG: single-stranded DNA-binding protein [Pseudomonadota bacterium]